MVSYTRLLPLPGCAITPVVSIYALCSPKHYVVKFNPRKTKEFFRNFFRTQVAHKLLYLLSNEYYAILLVRNPVSGTWLSNTFSKLMVKTEKYLDNL